MSDIISNEQIEQLLSASGFGDAVAKDDKTDTTTDVFFEKLCGVFCRQMSSVLTTVLSKKVAVELVRCQKDDAAAVREALAGDTITLSMPYAKGFTGEMYFVLPKKAVAMLCDLMMMGEGNAEYVPEHNDAVIELSNQIASSFAVALTNETGVPVAMLPSALVAYSPEAGGSLAVMAAKLSVEGKADAAAALVVPGPLYQQMTGRNAPGAAGSGGHDRPRDSFSDGGAFGGSFQDAAPAGRYQKENIDLLLDVDLDVSIELGRSTLSIKRILELSPGSIVELDRMAGEPVDLLVNNKVVAKGEVVVIDESFGIRILTLVSPEERIKSLR